MWQEILLHSRDAKSGTFHNTMSTADYLPCWGAKDMDFCTPNLVAICNKMLFSETNPFDGLSYYPLEHATSEHEESAEMPVMEKVLPFNEDSPNVTPWKNDSGFGIIQTS